MLQELDAPPIPSVWVNVVNRIRENAYRKIDETAIARAAGQSPRALEKKFPALVGRTPMEEAHAIRLRFWDYSIITFPPRRKTRLGKPSRSMSP